MAFPPLILYIKTVTSLDFEKLILALAAELKRRELHEHVEQLRPYYRGFPARRRAAMREQKPPWTEEFVLEWLCILGVPPFDHVVPTLGRGVRACACTTAEVGLPMIACVFPGGRLRECKGCGARWLERES
jgi:hypothetical protein